MQLDILCLALVQGRNGLVPEQARGHDIALVRRVNLVAALPCEVEGDAGDTLDLARRVEGGVDGALLAIGEGDDLLGLAEIGAAGQFAQNEDVEALDQLALQARGFGKRGIADGRAQVGEEVQLLPKLQDPRLGPDLESDLVPLRPADRAEDDGIGRLGLGQRRIGQRRAVLVDGDATDQGRLGGELGLGLLVQEGENALDLDHDLGTDAVAGHEKQLVVGHGVSLAR